MRIFITGGAGFIGTNVAAHHLALGHDVTVFDNLSRVRTEHNLAWLRAQPGHLTFVRGDIRDFATLREAMGGARPDLVLHLAAQVAVTTSVTAPREDFEINALGTFNVLEAARALPAPPAVFFASTNKVYGGLHDVRVEEAPTRHVFADLHRGVTEEQALDFHSPYGCSKGAGDQYVRDYARIYGLRTVVFRQSCIYGERQFGVEDQGWVAHFVIATAFGHAIKIYGDGKQVRDLLHVSDLVALYDAAWQRLDHVAGEVFNVGGGQDNSLSVWSEFGPLLERLAGRRPQVERLDWRPGDQPVFISDNSKALEQLSWRPKVAVEDGIERLWQWVTTNADLFVPARA